MLDPDLLSESRRLLDQARTIAEASAARPPDVRAAGQRTVTPGRSSPHSKQHKHAHPESAPPPGTFGYERSTLEACGERINSAIAADSDAQLRAANAWATREIKHLRHGSKEVAESDLEFERRVIRDYEGVTAPEVARVERSNVSRIRALRIKQGRSARFGQKIAHKGLGGA